MKIVSELKQFLKTRGSILDMAIGIVIGMAFGKIISSFIGDIFMPPFGAIIGGKDFTELKITLIEADYQGTTVVNEAVTMKVGNFLQTLLDFVIIVIAVFIVIIIINKIMSKGIDEPSKEEQLLTEIRDSLQNKPAVEKTTVNPVPPTATPPSESPTQANPDQTPN